MTRVGGGWINNKAAQRFLGALEDAGFEAYFVGGCVRNALLGLPVSDLDIATNAWPKDVIAVANSVGFKSVPTGIDHGTITVIGHGVPLETTTFRKDVETDGRHAVIAFADRLEDDAARRDFRMNALYADARGEVTDPTGGLQDIAARRLIFVGAAEARIKEDYLRILRLFRFAAQLGFGAGSIDEGTASLAGDLAGGLNHVSVERKTVEALKLLAAKVPLDVIEMMQRVGVLEAVLPGADVSLLSSFLGLEMRFAPPDPIARLAALGGGDALRLSKKQARFVADTLAATDARENLLQVAQDKGAEVAKAASLLRAAKASSTDLPISFDRLERAAAARFPVRASDLPHLEGAALGAALKRLKARWIESEFALGKDALLRGLSDEE